MMSAVDLARDVRSVAALPHVTIVLSRGAAHEEQLFAAFRRRHPRYLVIRRKSMGVALLDLSVLAGRDAYVATYAHVRYMDKKARLGGYQVRVFDPEDWRDDLHAIHTSTGVRQGRPMDSAYLSRCGAYARYPDDRYLGVFRDDSVVAYLHLVVAGEVAIMSRHIGHFDHLRNGVMYQLTAEAVAESKVHAGAPRFLMHDMYFGAPPGLRFFKAKNGFVPHRVRWTRAVTR
jgi:hypothetical protein